VSGTPWNLPIADLDAAVEAARSDLERWRGTRILITGGTGFLGSWITAVLLHANAKIDLNADLVVLTRRPKDIPLDPTDRLQLVEGDVRSLPEVGVINTVIHGATSSSAGPGSEDSEPRRLAETIVQGTQNVLNLASRSKARLLLLSSGAIYGKQRGLATAEEETSGPNTMDPHSAYAEGKRMSETLCALATESGSVEAVVARLFAFVGPRIPLDVHFAAGNFVGDAIAGRPIAVSGDGRAVRSYLYAGDLPEWCFRMLARGTPGQAYNVGSPEALSIGELARIASELRDPGLSVSIQGVPGEGPPHRYVPSTEKAERELGLVPRVPIRTAMEKTFRWAIEQS
jgi:nucleoside-diphosphate-sugar epimerase